MTRVVRNLKPSKEKGNGVKDCYIVELSLAVARAVGGPGYPRQLIFVSSNTSDFAASKTSPVIHPDLHADFTTAGMRYAISLVRAVEELRHAGELSP